MDAFHVERTQRCPATQVKSTACADGGGGRAIELQAVHCGHLAIQVLHEVNLRGGWRNRRKGMRGKRLNGEKRQQEAVHA